MALTPGEQAAYGKLWNFVQAVAPARSDTGGYAYQSSDILSAAATLAREAGQALSFTEAQGVFGLVSLARSQANAVSALNSAEPGQAIDTSMIATWPTAASLETQAAQPQYYARAEFTYTNNMGDETSAWISVSGINSLPATADALALRLTGAAISAYAKPEDEGGKYLAADQMASFGAITQMQLYTT